MLARACCYRIGWGKRVLRSLIRQTVCFMGQPRQEVSYPRWRYAPSLGRFGQPSDKLSTELSRRSAQQAERTHRGDLEVAGPLCTPLDVLARNASLPRTDVGDLVGVFQSGAYARSASPMGFLSHATPAGNLGRG